MCRCAQRRALLAESAVSLARGDLAEVRTNGADFARTVAADASEIARAARHAVSSRLAAAHGRLRA